MCSSNTESEIKNLHPSQFEKQDIQLLSSEYSVHFLKLENANQSDPILNRIMMYGFLQADWPEQDRIPLLTQSDHIDSAVFPEEDPKKKKAILKAKNCTRQDIQRMVVECYAKAQATGRYSPATHATDSRAGEHLNGLHSSVRPLASTQQWTEVIVQDKTASSGKISVDTVSQEVVSPSVYSGRKGMDHLPEIPSGRRSITSRSFGVTHAVAGPLLMVSLKLLKASVIRQKQPPKPIM